MNLTVVLGISICLYIIIMNPLPQPPGAVLLTSASRNGSRIGQGSLVGEPMLLIPHGNGRLSPAGDMWRFDILL